TVGAPLDQAAAALSGDADAAELSDRIRALGAEPRTAMLLGSALSARQAFAEIVYHALDPDEDRVMHRPVAVGVFYTKRGRVVAAPSHSPSGQLWTTLKPGSDHAIKQAIDQLVELSGYRWGDY
ncbi:ESX secretion-associated protein EspG, partial [Mycobacterium sp. NPDC003449]